MRLKKGIKTLIVLVGEPLAGKGYTYSRLAARVGKKNITHLCTGDIIREILGILNLPLERHYCDKLVMTLAKTFGKGFLARAIEAKILEASTKFVVFDCMRTLDDEKMVVRLRRNKKLRVVSLYITASPDKRFERLQARQRHGEHGMSRRRFNKNEKLPTVAMTLKIGLGADEIIENNGTPKEFKDKVLAFCNKYMAA